MSRIARARGLRRVALGSTAAVTVLASMSIGALAAKPQNGSSTANCRLSASGVGSTLTVNGSGYAANTSYRVHYVWPSNAGSSDTGVWSDPSGVIYTTTYAYWSGDYTVKVYGTSGSKPLLATCYLTVS